MNRRRQVPLFVILAAVLAGPDLGAQPSRSATPPPAPSSAAAIVGAEATANRKARTEPQPRSVPPATAALLRSAAPDDTPAGRAPSERNEEQPAPRETERPRNGIVRLPDFLVREPRIFIPPPRDMMTPRAKLDLALERHPGLRFGNLGPLNNNAIGMAMIDEQHRLERIEEAAEQVELLSPAQRTGTVAETPFTLALRPDDWRTTGGSVQSGP